MKIIEKLRIIKEALLRYQDIKREKDKLERENAEIKNLVNEIYEMLKSDLPAQSEEIEKEATYAPVKGSKDIEQGHS